MMPEQNHTRGPWRLHPSGKANLLDTWTVFYGYGETASNQICQAEHKEDAMLIAAAPDLLAACKKLLDAPHQEHFSARLNDEEMEGIREIRAAILKAEGQTEAVGK